jgi:uncharacterized protein YndB with AHSA1/START domain
MLRSLTIVTVLGGMLGSAWGAADTAAAQTSSAVTVSRRAEPRQLIFDVDVPADGRDVWAALTTSEGMRTWVAPDAKVDLRPGGDWLALFPGAAPGGGTIESLSPPTTLVIHAMAPERFPEVRAVGTTATFTLTACGDRCTHVRLAQTGWRQGGEWDEAFEYLAGGNAQLLDLLHRRFVSRPIKWK